MSNNKAQESAALQSMTAKKRSVRFLILVLVSLMALLVYFQLLKPAPKLKTAAVKKNTVSKLQKKALTLYRKQKFPQAIKNLNLYLQQRPNDMAARKMLANSYEQLNQLNKALNEYQIISKQTKDVNILYETAILLSSQEKYADAIKLLKKAKQIMPDNLLIKIELAKTYSKTNQLNEAEKQWQEIVESLDTSDAYKATAYAELGDVLKLGGQLQKAKDAYEAGLKIEPTNDYLKQQLSQLEEATPQ